MYDLCKHVRDKRNNFDSAAKENKSFANLTWDILKICDKMKNLPTFGLANFEITVAPPHKKATKTKTH